MNPHSPTPPTYGPLEQQAASKLIRLAIAEDLGENGIQGDRTGQALIAADAMGRVEIRNRQAGTVCGIPVVNQLLTAYAPAVTPTWDVEDGARLDTVATVGTLEGPVQHLLALERIALNVLGYLSGIATSTAAHVEAVHGTRAVVLDTRKTLPGWRHLAKYAVACGGGTNHRMGLFDAILIKDNHLASLGNARDVATAVSVARNSSDPGVLIQVEVDTLEQLEDALKGGPDMVLLDNMTNGQLTQAVATRDQQAPGVLLEASGGITLTGIAAVAATGVDRISLGGLTHTVTNWDVGFDWVG